MKMGGESGVTWTLIFASLYLAELPDKTSVATLALLRRHKPLLVWMGAGLALIAQTVLALVAGRLLSLVPRRPLTWVEVLFFLGFAVWLWRNSGGRDDSPLQEVEVGAPSQTVVRVFFLVFVAEFLDLTQMTTIAFAAHHPGRLLAIGVVAALALVLANATIVGFGQGLLRRIPGSWIERGAAIVFVVIGLLMGLGQFGWSL